MSASSFQSDLFSAHDCCPAQLSSDYGGKKGEYKCKGIR
jgi:hypothetical protein